MSEGNAATVRAIHEAFDRQDLEGLVGLLDEGIDWQVPSSVQYGGHFTGHDGVSEFFAQIPEHWEEIHVRVDELVEAGDVVLDLVTISGRGKGGSDFQADGSFVWRFSGGKPVSFKEYSDTATIRDGLAQTAGASV
jgi:uncharacterized protein